MKRKDIKLACWVSGEYEGIEVLASTHQPVPIPNWLVRKKGGAQLRNNEATPLALYKNLVQPRQSLDEKQIGRIMPHRDVDIKHQKHLMARCTASGFNGCSSHTDEASLVCISL